MSSPPLVSAPTTTPGSSDYAAFRRALRRAAPALRRDLPWINDPRPWAVLVSEVMLQQTQTSRVLEPWRRFLELFPTPTHCADAPLSSVLTAWAGLGYPRRAKSLHGAARVIRDEFAGIVPSDVILLRQLPGVGEYTAHAVASFAFARPVAVLDTNVGRVLARALENRTLGHSEARTLAAALLPSGNSAAFNQAMLDLGAQFCRAAPRCDVCPLRAQCAWHRHGGEDPAPQSAAVSRAQTIFAGSNRQLRGHVIRALTEAPRTVRQLARVVSDVAPSRRREVLDSLVRDGLITRDGETYCLAAG
ncbi:MAG TPA: A/G-specific adenine glycosylase [Acidimicrobiales bacterium]